MNKATGGDGIPVDLFQILKDDAVKCCTQYTSKFGKLTSGHRTGKDLFTFRSQRQCQRMFKLPHNCTHLTHQQSHTQNSPSQASTVCKLRTPRCSNWILKRQGNRNQIANICWIMEKAREFQKNIYFCFIDYSKAFDCMDHHTINCGKF